MTEIILGLVAMIITQLSKKTGIDPRIIAAILCYGAAFLIQAMNHWGDFAISDFQSVLNGVGTIGTASWAAAIASYEILKKPLANLGNPQGEESK